MNRSIGKFPFQVVNGRNFMGVLDLVHVLLGDRITDYGEAFVKKIQQL